jgi:hypothetical protein
MKRILWQFWETRGQKPKYIDELHQLCVKNAGVDVILTSPENIHDYLDHIPDPIMEIPALEHKADMIRTMLIEKHGGMWLDSDALVLRDLNPYFDLLEEHEFVVFCPKGRLGRQTRSAKVNCFLSRPGGKIISGWRKAQHEKLPKTSFRWTEIGSDLLHPLCAKHHASCTVMPFEEISPIKWIDWPLFLRDDLNARSISEKCKIVMVNIPGSAQIPSYHSLRHTLLTELMRTASDHGYTPSSGRWPMNTSSAMKFLVARNKFGRFIGKLVGE